MTAKSLGPITAGLLAVDQDGHRTYRQRYRVEAALTDSPYDVLNAEFLPALGSSYTFESNLDPTAYRSPEAAVTPYDTNEHTMYWYVDLMFTTKPRKRCQDNTVENPLDEPAKISGSFVKIEREVERDRNGKLIKSSSHEIIHGVMKDDSRPTIVIEQNVANLQLALIAYMLRIAPLNDSDIWGLDQRMVKFSAAPWSQKFYGTCSLYYTRRLEFEVNYDTWDRDDIADVGYKKFDSTVAGSDRSNPTHFIIAKDRKGDNPPERIALDGFGDPLEDLDNPVFIPTVELYDESNYYLLGVPSSL